VRLEGERAGAEARRLYANALQGAFLLLTPSILLLAYIARPFLSVWAGQRYGAHSTQVAYVVFAGVWFNAMAYIPQVYLFANGRAWVIARLHLGEIIPYLLAAALVTANFGALGAAVVWSARSLIDASIMFPLASRAGGVTLSPLSSRRLRSMLAPALLAIGVIVLSQVTSGLGVRVVVVFVVAVIYSVMFWALALADFERAGLSALMAQLNPISRLRRR
jgi:O-antigen/teichoic acid export membrane protein